MRRFFTIIASVFLALSAGSGRAETIYVAVASNFQTTAQTLAVAFGVETGHEVLISTGSSGRLYAQIRHGAPFDVFLSADQERPMRLVETGSALDTRSYALGQLVLLGPARDIAPLNAPPDYQTLNDARIAVADPALAPYGVASFEALEALGLNPQDLDLVYGENVTQAAAYFYSGNAEFALIGVAQLESDRLSAGASSLALTGSYADIRQDAALLANSDSAQQFYDYLISEDARQIIRAAGYAIP